MMPPEDYKVAINFFRIFPQDFRFTVFRRLRHDEGQARQFSGAKFRRLPSHHNSQITEPNKADEYRGYWVQYDDSESLESYECHSRTNLYLTLDYLFHLLKAKTSRLLESDWKLDEKSKGLPRLLYVLQHHDVGDEVVWLQPYFLRHTREFGFLCDFKLDQPPYSKPTKRSLELSLATKNGQPDRDHYADRFGKLQSFVARYLDKLSPLRPEPSHITLESKLIEIKATMLKPKTYIFAGDQTSKSQFIGVKEQGPLSSANNDVKIYFIYLPSDRALSHDLFRALRGDTFKTFPGMEAMFRIKMDSDRVSGMPLESFDILSLERLCAKICEDSEGRPVVPVLIFPFSKFSGEQNDRFYYLAKHTFLKRRWPSQFVGRHTLIDRNALKWSVSNIGLALFAKMGGQPWKVRPETDRCLIVGLGQAHRIVEDSVEKYFAYSVLTDSSGLYKDIRVLGRSSDEKIYLQEFKEKLEDIFREFAPNFDRFVIHSTFKISKTELSAVKALLERMKPLLSENGHKKEFVVIKFNDKNRFFGYSRASNSLIPYESSFVPISNFEYLIWFEGLQLHNPNIIKRIERPVHVEFLYSSDAIDEQQRIKYLQDSLNLSGANWRGFNAKSLPVSIYYAKLIATFFAQFQTLDLEEIDLSAINPWFL
jgi:hypothetical protein